MHETVVQNPVASSEAYLRRFVKIGFVLAVFGGAFLLFTVEPLIGKIVTPKFGGISAVWSMCMLFFQAALLAGYAMTYLISKLAPRRQAVVYCGLMLASLLFVRIPPAPFWDPGQPDQPIRNLLILLVTRAAVPCILLSTVSGMMQNWFSLSRFGNPYPLYSVSNLGSLGALLAYPALIEPNLSITTSLRAWNLGYILLVVVACATPLFMAKTQATVARCSTDRAQSAVKYFWWLLLSASGSVLLLGFTNEITHNIAPVPLLWVIPLAIYLLTFVFAFSERRIYRRSIYVPVAQVLLVLFLLPRTFGPVIEGLHALALLYVLCMICHGELASSKPPPAHLPIYYLVIALGGMIGGVLVNLVAPVVFVSYAELPLALIFMAALTVALAIRHDLQIFNNRRAQRVFLGIVIPVALVCAYGQLRFGGRDDFGRLVYRGRNFYGTAEVRFNPDSQIISVFNGAIVHGAQFRSPEMRTTPLTYYHRHSAVALVEQLLRERRNGQPLRIGAVGLGAGTVAVYAREGDEIIFYELDPKMREIAQQQFTYLKDLAAKQRVDMGDARLTLQRQSPQQFDLLIVDAFSGDSIPVHLLTEEAGRLYLKHMKPDGVLLIHCSNRYLYLWRVVDDLGSALTMPTFNIFSGNLDLKQFIFRSNYVAIAPDGWLGGAIAKADIEKQFPKMSITKSTKGQAERAWTDDYSNVISTLYFTSPSTAK